MKIFFNILILISFHSHACEFKAGYRHVYSLSGPVTKVLEEVGLLHKLKGISVFYPPVKEFKGELIPGGIFLSPSTLNSMKGSLVFFDQSHDLHKMFSGKDLTPVEVNGRNKTPQEVVSSVIGMLRGYVKGCDFDPVFQKTSQLEKQIRDHSGRIRIIFFLGEAREGKLPELVIANDGLVMWLRKNSLVSTYPSDLAYVNWSGSIMEELRKDHLLLGLKEDKVPRLRGDKKRGTLFYPGALTPGLHQLEAWVWFLKEGRGKLF